MTTHRLRRPPGSTPVRARSARALLAAVWASSVFLTAACSSGGAELTSTDPTAGPPVATDAPEAEPTVQPEATGVDPAEDPVTPAPTSTPESSEADDVADEAGVDAVALDLLTYQDVETAIEPPPDVVPAPDPVRARLVVDALAEAGVATTGVDIYVLAVPGTAGSLLVLEAGDDAQLTAEDSEGDAFALTLLEQMELLDLTQLVFNIDTTDELGPLLVTLTLSRSDFRAVADGTADISTVAKLQMTRS